MPPPKRKTRRVRTVFGAGGRREAMVPLVSLEESLVGPANHIKVPGGEALNIWPDAADTGGVSAAAIWAALGEGVTGRPVEDALADLDDWPPGSRS